VWVVLTALIQFFQQSHQLAAVAVVVHKQMRLTMVVLVVAQALLARVHRGLVTHHQLHLHKVTTVALQQLLVLIVVVVAVVLQRLVLMAAALVTVVQVLMPFQLGYQLLALVLVVM
jgi:hypothetical protein